MFDNCQIGDPLGVGPGISWNPPSGAVVVANPNLLLWTDELDNAVWVKTDAIITPDVAGVADEWTSLAVTSAVRQVTSTAATTGSAVTATFTPRGTPTHGEVSGTFDGVIYTFSCLGKDGGSAETPSITLRIDRSGGFLRCSAEDPAGDGDYVVKNFQLEVGPFTTYHARGGV